MPRQSRKALHSSQSNEWYTPRWVIEIAEGWMGPIDLDPASSAAANTMVQAANYYTAADNGLQQPWFGNVWLNPPYGGEGAEWVVHMLAKHRDRAISRGVLLVNAVPDRKWFAPLWDYPSLWFYDRIRFLDPKTLLPQDSPTNANVLFFIGPPKTWQSELFHAIGGRYGRIVAPAPFPGAGFSWSWP